MPDSWERSLLPEQAAASDKPGRKPHFLTIIDLVILDF